MAIPFLLLLLVCGCQHYVISAQIPLQGGAEEGEYMMHINIGSPPQYFVVRIDTSSYALFIPAGCSQCQRNFIPSKSSSYSDVPCIAGCVCNITSPTTSGSIGSSNKCGIMDLFDGDGGGGDGGGKIIRGYVGNDSISLFGNFTLNTQFVTLQNQPPSLVGSSANGIFGMSAFYPAYSKINLQSQLVRIDNSNSSDFSLCLGEFGGQLILGGYDSNYVGSDIVWVPTINSNFTLELTDFKLAEHSVWDSLWPNSNINCENCTLVTINSGHQYLILPANAYAALKSLFQQQLCPEHGVGPVGICSDNSFFDGNCYIMDDSSLDGFPIIELTFNGSMSIQIPPTNYFVDYNGKSCLALESGSGNSVIIGNRIMQEYYTIFQTSQNRIGFTKAVNCSGAQYRVEAVSGDGQFGDVGTRLAYPLVIRVRRLDNNESIGGVTVSFNVVDVTPAAEVMWISQAIWQSQPARVDPAIVTTAPDGTAQTFLWLSGSADENTVTADIPLCLNHVVFVATGQQSYIWQLLTFLFLLGLVGIVLVLNVWYKRAMRKQKLQRYSTSCPSSLDISSNHFLTYDDSYNFDTQNNTVTHENNRDIMGDNNSDVDDELPANNKKWYQQLYRKLNWNMWRFNKQIQNVIYRRE